MPARAKEIAALDGFGDKAVANLSIAIEAARTAPFAKLLFALGIRHMGHSTAKLVAQHYETAEAWVAAMANFDEGQRAALQAIDGIGETLVTALATHFAEPTHLAEVRALLKVMAPTPEQQATGGAFAGQTLVFTGTLGQLTREEAKARAEAAGARVSSSLSAKTSLLVAGEKAGSKAKKAIDLGVEVIDEAAFLARLSQA